MTSQWSRVSDKWINNFFSYHSKMQAIPIAWAETNLTNTCIENYTVERFSIECRKYFVFSLVMLINLLISSLTGWQNSYHSVNRYDTVWYADMICKPKTNLQWLPHVHFPTLCSNYLLLILIGSLHCFHLLWSIAGQSLCYGRSYASPTLSNSDVLFHGLTWQ